MRTAATESAEANPVTDPRPRVVAILPRGEAIRNFAYSGALDGIRAGADLTVLTVVPSAEFFASLVARYDRVLPLAVAPEPYAVRVMREVLDVAHGKHLWSAAAQERWRLRDLEADTPLKRLKRLGYKFAASPFASHKGVLLLERAERGMSRALSSSKSYERLFRELRPSLVFNGSHVHSHNAVRAVQTARWMNIPTAAFIFSWDNLTSQGRIIPEYDYYLVWSDTIAQQLREIYPHVAPDRIVVTGSPQFDGHFRPEGCWSREELCNRIGAAPERPLVLYSTGMANHMRGEPAVVEQLADMLAELRDEGPPQLVVRVYPKDRSGRFDQLKERRPDILFAPTKWIDQYLTPTAEDSVMLSNLLRHAAVGINIASTISLELCMFDKPVVNVGYDPPDGTAVEVPFARYYEYDHYRPLVSFGAVSVARSPLEMQTLLRDALDNPSRARAQRAALLQHLLGDTLDGQSAERVASALLMLASRSHP
jgi:hypothetical protein